METASKNRLQEYCQKHKIPLPNYRIKQQSGPPHMLKFQVEVEVNGQWYIGDDLCSSKKEAEQSAAKKAWNALIAGNMFSIPVSPVLQSSMIQTSEEYSEAPPPSYSEIVQTNLTNYLPDEYTDIEQFIDAKVKPFGGRIRKISAPDSYGRYKFEINGSYRYCENVRRHHKKNQIYFIVDPIKKTYIQKCHDPSCYGFQSPIKYIVTEQSTSHNSQENNSVSKCSRCQRALMLNNRNECDRCGEEFCNKCVRDCELCHNAVHCERCFELCFDCHDS